MVTESTFNTPIPRLVRVTVWVALAWATLWSPKATAVGSNEVDEAMGSVQAPRPCVQAVRNLLS